MFCYLYAVGLVHSGAMEYSWHVTADQEVIKCKVIDMKRHWNWVRVFIRWQEADRRFFERDYFKLAHIP